MKFFVSRQHYWGMDNEDAYVCEIAQGGLDYANPDMLGVKYRHLGEGKEYSDVREAANAAINICQAWRKDGQLYAKVALGCTYGNTLPFEGQDYHTIRQRAEAIYDKLPKCDQCGDLLGDDDETFTNDMGDKFCSERCAEKSECEDMSEELEDSHEPTSPT